MNKHSKQTWTRFDAAIDFILSNYTRIPRECAIHIVHNEVSESNCWIYIDDVLARYDLRMADAEATEMTSVVEEIMFEGIVPVFNKDGSEALSFYDMYHADNGYGPVTSAAEAKVEDFIIDAIGEEAAERVRIVRNGRGGLLRSRDVARYLSGDKKVFDRVTAFHLKKAISNRPHTINL